MNVVSAKYLTHTPVGGSAVTVGIRVDTGDEILVIPINSDNSDYAEIMRQVEAGELVIEPADEGSE